MKISKSKITRNNVHEEEFKTRSNVTGNEEEIKRNKRRTIYVKECRQT